MRLVSLLLLLSFFTFLTAQTIVLVNKESDLQLNTLEKLHLNVVLEMSDFLLFNVVSTEVLAENNIPFQVLTPDYVEQPLVVVSSDTGNPLKQTAYIGEIVVNSENLRIERLADKHVSTTRKGDIKFIPLRIFDRLFTNTHKVLPAQMPPFNDRSITEIINSVDPDSIAYFIQVLQDFGTRFCMHDNRYAIAQWIADQFTRWGYDDVSQISYHNTNYNIDQNNVVAIELGSEYPDQYIVMGAHYDSVNQDGPIYETSMNFAPGADDNATGTAAVLEVARVLKANNFQPKYSIRFVAFSMEELGLFGSYYDVDYILAEGIDVVTMINCDMIGHNPNQPYVFTIYNYPNADNLTNLALQLGTGLEMQMTTDDEMIHRSDSWSYHLAGIPAIFFSETTFTPYYHTSQDLLSNIHVPYITQTIKLVANLLVNVAQMPMSPTDFMLYDVGNGSSLMATWTALPQPDVEYLLTITNTITQEAHNFTTTNNSYTFTGLTANTPYQVILSAVIDEYTSYGLVRSEITRVIPRQVTGVNSTPQYREILLSWSPSIELDLSSYKVFRRLEGTGGFSEIASIPATQHAYTDNTTQDLLWYEYYIICVDNDENTSPNSQIIRTRHLTFSEGLLIIDLTVHGSTNPLNPPNDATDAFYRELVDGYRFTEVSSIDANSVKVENLGIYSTIVVHKNSFNYAVNDQLAVLLKNFVTAGGNVIYSANDPLHYSGNTLMGIDYPWSFSAGDFAYDVLGINTINYNSTARFVRAASTGWGQLGDLELDETKLNADQFGYTLNRLEVYTSDMQNVLYTYQSDSSNPTQAAFDNKPVAIYTQYGNSHIVLTSIPLYFIKQHQAKAFVQAMLVQFGEELSDYDDALPYVPDIRLTNYPNPFNPVTTISFVLPVKANVEVTVFNIKGQKVGVVLSAELAAGEHSVVWDAGSLSSGVYFYQVKAGEVSKVKKMVLVK